VLQLCVNLGRRGIVREKGEGWRYEFKGGGGVNAFEGRGGRKVNTVKIQTFEKGEGA